MSNQQDEARRVERRKFLKNAGLAGLAATGSGLMGAALAQETGGAAEAQDLSGKVAIVTGARNNLGRAYAVGLAERGANVLVHYHREETRDQAEETARLVQEAGGQTAFAIGDLGQTANVVAMFDAAESAFGGVDILINNAGAIEKDFVVNLSDEEIDRVMNINLRGTFLCCREAARRLRGEGRIINIASSLVDSMTPGYAIYAGTKAAISQFTKTMAGEVSERRITVNAVAPGSVDNPFFYGEESPGAARYATTLASANRFARNDDIAPTVMFLASPASQWVSGQTLYVNGGYFAS